MSPTIAIVSTQSSCPSRFCPSCRDSRTLPATVEPLRDGDTFVALSSNETKLCTRLLAIGKREIICHKEMPIVSPFCLG